MKRFRWVIGTLLLAFVPVLAWVSVADAQRFSTNVDQGQTVNSSLYSAGKDIEINGTVNGDIFCGGQNIKINAIVHGDVICAGQDVTIDGKIDGDVRAAGQLVTLKGEVAKNATVAAMTFSLDAGAKVGQDLTAMGDTLNIKGFVGRDVVAGGNSLILNGPVGRNVKADAASVKLKSDAKIGGNFAYTSSKNVNKASGAVVNGKTTHDMPKKKKAGPRFSLGLYLFVLFSLLLISLVIAYVFPQFLRKTSDNAKQNLLKTAVVGLVASFVVPMVSLGLVLTVVGIPLTLVVLLAWLFASALTAPIAGYYVGRMVFRDKRKNPLLIMLVGGAILTTTYFFWFVGMFFVMLSYWIGMGALLLTIQKQVRPAELTAKKPKKASTES